SENSSDAVCDNSRVRSSVRPTAARTRRASIAALDSSSEEAEPASRVKERPAVCGTAGSDLWDVRGSLCPSGNTCAGPATGASGRSLIPWANAGHNVAAPAAMDAAIKAYFIAIPIVSSENACVHALIGMRLRDAQRAAPRFTGLPLWWLAGTFVASRTHENVIGSRKMKKIFWPAAAGSEPSWPGPLRREEIL